MKNLCPGALRASIWSLWACGALATAARAQGDQWSQPVLLRSGDSYVAPIHGTLLPSGEVMLIGYLQDAPAASGCGRFGNTTALLDPDQATGASVNVAVYAEDVPYNQGYCPGEGVCGVCSNPNCLTDSYFCSGHTLLANGDLAVFGGLRTFMCSTHGGLGTFTGGGGLAYGSVWDWDALLPAWSRTSATFAGSPVNPIDDGFYFEGTERYYPTATRLPSGKVLVTGGTQVLTMTQLGAGGGVIVDPGAPVLNLTAELFDPAGQTFAAIATPPPATAAAIYNPDYTHACVLPVRKGAELYNVVMIGQDGQPVYLRTATGSWSAPGPTRPGIPAGTNPICKGASTLMLPIRQANGQYGYSNGSLLVTGGEDVGASIDVYDEDQSAWTLALDLAEDRHHPATVLLPDGKVVALGGHVPGQTTGFIDMYAEYIDTRNWTVASGSVAPGEITRGYHMVALLLPDGRVMVAGGRPGGVGSSPHEHASVQFLSPPYMFRTRPEILSHPPTITANGAMFEIDVDMAYSEVVLVSLGSMTHSVDMNQRHVQLQMVLDPVLIGQPPSVAGIVPPTRREAPPGYYMLFALAADDSRTPSEGVIVQVL